MAVAREDLFDQGRAGARKADDENRRRPNRIPARMPLEEFAAEYFRDLFVAAIRP